MSHGRNIFTVDLEEWFVVEVLADRYDRRKWHWLDSSVERNSLALLDLLDRHKVKATWFVLGWCAQRYPNLIAEIFGRGHEVACHSFFHRRVDSLSPEEFRQDTIMAIEAIVMATGNVPYGYRAPSWSIGQKTPWAFEILSNLGFLYDSSIFPIKHDLYGWPGGPRSLFKMNLSSGRTLYELPATTYRLLGKNLPVSGGGYFRHSPFWYSKRLIRHLNDNGQPAVFYIHPWEIDPNLPRIEGLSPLQRLRTYGSNNILRHKVERLLESFEFTSVADYIGLFRKNRIGF